MKIYLENLDEDTLKSDHKLMKELMECDGFSGHPLGIVLLLSNVVCKLCNGQMVVRKDRLSFPVVYTECFGTVSGTHFRKYCQNNGKGCSFTQHYAYHTTSTNLMEYDRNCLDLPKGGGTPLTVVGLHSLHAACDNT